jgi:DNA-binding MarR family transcriptional regulator
METECYCAALRHAARKITDLYDEALAPAQISVAQFSLLRRVMRIGPVSLTELSRQTGLDRSTIGRNVKVLVHARLLAAADGEDAREACVMVSPAGRAAVATALPLWRRAQRSIETALGADVADGLRKLSRSM